MHHGNTIVTKLIHVSIASATPNTIVMLLTMSSYDNQKHSTMFQNVITAIVVSNHTRFDSPERRSDVLIGMR